MKRLVRFTNRIRKTVGHVRWRSLVVLLIALLALVTTGCASLARNPDELARTWQSAWVLIPGDHRWSGSMSNPLTQSAAFHTDRKFPVVLYMHGCAGLSGSDPLNWGSFLQGAGYVVIAPYSFARQYRPETCAPSSATASYAPDVYEMRVHEIDYAVSQMRTLPWVDQDNLFLLGNSEGGVAVAAYRGGAFRGYIITGWTCRQGYHTDMDGLWVPSDKPVLAIVFADDPWYPNPWQRGHCGEKFGNRRGSKSIVIPGSGHSTAGHPTAQDAVLEFLRQHSMRREVSR